MVPRKVIYQRFHHPILSGVVFGWDRFVFRVAFDDVLPICDEFLRMGIEVVAGEVRGVAEILEYLAGERRKFSVHPMPLWGTPFQRRIWCETRNIPYGETMTYSHLALLCGRPGAARAVGNALAKNPIPIVIPCHRIIPKSGGLGNFSAGKDVKAKLLKIEGVKI